MEKIYDCIVVGGGIAGYSAALTLKSLKRDALWLGAELYGEKLRAAEYVRNYPALVGGGALFAERLEEQREKEGVLFTQGRADAVYAGDVFTVTAGEKTYLGRTVILATGVSQAGAVKGEENFLGRGVSYCAVCDGALYRGKVIAAVVASEKYAEEVEYLAGFASCVHAFCLYRDAHFHAPNIVLHREVPRAVEGGLLENLYSLLAGYGVTAQEGLVVDLDRAHYAFGYPYILMPDLNSSPVTDSSPKISRRLARR